jgi:EF-P beta-lysylation protein EpmB
MNIVASPADSVRTGSEGWQALLKSAIRDVRELQRRLRLPGFGDHATAATRSPRRSFATFVPLPFLERMVPGDPRDPLLLQVLPKAAEDEEVPGFRHDAVGDLQAERLPGLIHKYAGRALLVSRGVCAVHCRYCFRRHYPYQQAPVSLDRLDQTLDVVRHDSSMEELILSGGDPLMMTDDGLHDLLSMIDGIGHLQRLRIHTRLPVVIPQRVTDRLLQVLSGSRLTTVVVLHINHPREIDDAVTHAMRRLRDCPLTLLNQSVLLKGVNDRIDVLLELSRQLVARHCLPYYLHQLDRVAGTAHFEVPESQGLRLLEQMRGQLPGYAVPRYVREIPGAAAKHVIA